MGDEYTGSLQRAEDGQFPWRISRSWGKWRWAITPLGWIAVVVMGVRFSGPASDNAAVNKRVDHVEAAVSSLRDTVVSWHNARIADNEDMRRMLEFVVRDRCNSMTPKEISHVGGGDACDAALHPLDHAIKTRLRAPGEPPQ